MNPFQTCPDCGQSVRIVYQDDVNKDSLAFEVHTEKDYVTRCSGSRRLVNLKPTASTPEVLSTAQVVAVPVTSQPKVAQPEISKPPQLPVAICQECSKSIRTKLNLRGTVVLIEHYNTIGRRCTNSLKPIPSAE